MNKMQGPETIVGDEKEGGKRSAWMTHVKKTMRAHKGMKLMQVLKLAKKTYTKKAKRGGGAGGVGSTASPLGGQDGGRRRRGTRKSRSRKH
jgi:hypothetical protein